MNVREGMRRLGILLGVCGGIMGGLLGYGDAQDLWHHWKAHRKFNSLMSSATMQDMAKAAREYQSNATAGGRLDPDEFMRRRLRIAKGFGLASGPADSDLYERLAESPTYVKYSDRKIWWDGPNIDRWMADQEHAQKSKLRDPWEEAAKGDSWKVWDPNFGPGTLPRDFFNSPGSILISVSKGGVRRAMADKSGLVLSIEPDAGLWIDRTEAPPLKAYLVLLYPAFGFLIPWGAIRVLTWVGTGFLAEVHR
jgi:hypothetical protein